MSRKLKHSQEAFMKYHLLYESGMVGHFQKEFYGCVYDINVLGKRLDQFSFLSSCTYSTDKDTFEGSRAAKAKILCTAMENAPDDTWLFRPVSMVITLVGGAGVSAVLAEHGFAVVGVLICIGIAVLICVRGHDRMLRRKLYEALLIIANERELTSKKLPSNSKTASILRSRERDSRR